MTKEAIMGGKRQGEREERQEMGWGVLLAFIAHGPCFLLCMRQKQAMLREEAVKRSLERHSRHSREQDR